MNIATTLPFGNDTMGAIKPLIYYFSPDPAMAVEDVFDSVPYKKGQLLFVEKNTPYSLYYVKSGKVKISKVGMDGKEQIIRIATAGDFVGYRELLMDMRYTTSAAVLENAQLYVVPKEDFMELLQTNQEVAKAFNNMLCRDRMEAEQKLVDMAYKPVRSRLAETLITHVQQSKSDKPNQISLSREDLARIVGTAKETVIRVLADFKAAKLIRNEGRSINVLNISGLTGISRLYN